MFSGNLPYYDSIQIEAIEKDFQALNLYQGNLPKYISNCFINLKKINEKGSAGGWLGKKYQGKKGIQQLFIDTIAEENNSIVKETLRKFFQRAIKPLSQRYVYKELFRNVLRIGKQSELHNTYQWKNLPLSDRGQKLLQFHNKIIAHGNKIIKKDSEAEFKQWQQAAASIACLIEMEYNKEIIILLGALFEANSDNAAKYKRIVPDAGGDMCNASSGVRFHYVVGMQSDKKDVQTYGRLKAKRIAFEKYMADMEDIIDKMLDCQNTDLAIEKFCYYIDTGQPCAAGKQQQAIDKVSIYLQEEAHRIEDVMGYMQGKKILEKLGKDQFNEAKELFNQLLKSRKGQHLIIGENKKIEISEDTKLQIAESMMDYDINFLGQAGPDYRYSYSDNYPDADKAFYIEKLTGIKPKIEPKIPHQEIINKNENLVVDKQNDDRNVVVDIPTLTDQLGGHQILFQSALDNFIEAKILFDEMLRKHHGTKIKKDDGATVEISEDNQVEIAHIILDSNPAIKMQHDIDDCVNVLLGIKELNEIKRNAEDVDIILDDRGQSYIDKHPYRFAALLSVPFAPWYLAYKIGTDKNSKLTKTQRGFAVAGLILFGLVNIWLGPLASSIALTRHICKNKSWSLGGKVLAGIAIMLLGLFLTAVNIFSTVAIGLGTAALGVVGSIVGGVSHLFKWLGKAFFGIGTGFGIAAKHTVAQGVANTLASGCTITTGAILGELAVKIKPKSCRSDDASSDYEYSENQMRFDGHKNDAGIVKNGDGTDNIQANYKVTLI